jgi:hypothetical protein
MPEPTERDLKEKEAASGIWGTWLSWSSVDNPSALDRASLKRELTNRTQGVLERAWDGGYRAMIERFKARERERRAALALLIFMDDWSSSLSSRWMERIRRYEEDQESEFPRRPQWEHVRGAGHRIILAESAAPPGAERRTRERRRLSNGRVVSFPADPSSRPDPDEPENRRRRRRRRRAGDRSNPFTADPSGWDEFDDPDDPDLREEYYWITEDPYPDDPRRVIGARPLVYPSDADAEAADAVTSANTYGEFFGADEIRAQGRDSGGLVAFWKTEPGACKLCSPLHIQPPRIWRPVAPNGPPLHRNCRCSLEWHNRFVDTPGQSRAVYYDD